MTKIPPTVLHLPLFISIDWLFINSMCDWFCAETIQFLYFVQFDLLELQRFCFQLSSCHSFSTSSFLCEYRINHCIEFITGQKLLVFFYPRGFICRWCQNNVWSLVIIYFFSQNNRPTLDWKFKNDWTKRMQKLSRKCFTYLS